MFNKDFYPTPNEVIEQMLYGYDLDNKVVLEPSAGKGNIVKYVKTNYKPKQILACEIEPELRVILEKQCTVIADDFLTLTPEKVSHVDYIVMNPPFSADEKHIAHAFEIAPSGCTIIALCASSVFEYSRYNKLKHKINELCKLYGYHEELGSVFKDSERSTKVVVEKVILQKPYEDSESMFDDYFDYTPESEYNTQYEGLMPYNAVRDVVNRYTATLKLYDKQLEIATQINQLTAEYYSIGKMCLSVETKQAQLTKNEFKKELTKQSWLHVLKLMKFQQTLTTSLKADINKFVETQEKIPFTMRNVYRMIEIIIGTHESRMDKAIVDVFYKLTEHAKENRLRQEGWVSNKVYMINKKIVIPYAIKSPVWESRPRLEYGRFGSEIIDDFYKAYCYIVGKPYSDRNGLYHLLLGNECVSFGELFSWDDFQCRAYKKGTLHIILPEDKQALINQKIASIVGFVIPTKTSSKKARKAQTA